MKPGRDQNLTGTKPPLRYSDAGVDIARGDAFVEAVKPLARSTSREGCLGGLGGFGAMFEIPKRFRDPILVSGTDGVGTKIKLAFALERHDTVGIDLVAMCANDVLSQGAEPLFFLDYFAAGKLDPARDVTVVEGIAEGCRQAGAALVGGETAEMPGMYADGEYELAGFCVGAVERSGVVDGSTIAVGDAVVGIPSSGPHANGYSLIRHVMETTGNGMDTRVAGTALAEHLLRPTRIYVKPVLALLQQLTVHGIAHITGGGLPGNLARILPRDHAARLHSETWSWPSVFQWLQNAGNIDSAEMYRTFNCGIGMVLVVPAGDADAAVHLLSAEGQDARIIGEIQPRKGAPEVSIE